MVKPGYTSCLLLIQGVVLIMYGQPNPGYSYQDTSHALEEQPSMKCYVVAGMIIVVPANVTEEVRNDVLYSLLYAQLKADGQANRNSQFLVWLDNYFGVYNDIFLNVNFSAFTDLNLNQSQFAISDLALQKLAYFTNTKPYVSTFAKVFDILRNQPESNKAIQLLMESTYDPSKNDTTQIFCSISQPSADQNPMVYMLALSLDSVVKEASSKLPLFHKYLTKDVERIEESYTETTLIEEKYANIRKNITNKLGDYVQSKISEIQLTK